MGGIFLSPDSTSMSMLASEKEVSRVDLESALSAISFSCQVLNPLRSDNLKSGCSKTLLTSLLIELSDFEVSPSNPSSFIFLQPLGRSCIHVFVPGGCEKIKEEGFARPSGVEISKLVETVRHLR